LQQAIIIILIGARSGSLYYECLACEWVTVIIRRKCCHCYWNSPEQGGEFKTAHFVCCWFVGLLFMKREIYCVPILKMLDVASSADIMAKEKNFFGEWRSWIKSRDPFLNWHK
jgi:hypothetical protein